MWCVCFLLCAVKVVFILCVVASLWVAAVAASAAELVSAEPAPESLALVLADGQVHLLERTVRVGFIVPTGGIASTVGNLTACTERLLTSGLCGDGGGDDGDDDQGSNTPCDRLRAVHARWRGLAGQGPLDRLLGTATPVDHFDQVWSLPAWGGMEVGTLRQLEFSPHVAVLLEKWTCGEALVDEMDLAYRTIVAAAAPSFGALSCRSVKARLIEYNATMQGGGEFLQGVDCTRLPVDFRHSGFSHN